MIAAPVFHAALLAAAAAGVTVRVDPSVTYQQMEGFGVSLTDSSAWLLNNRLTTPQRDAVLNALFSPTTGIGVSFLRQPMGASDFATSNYTYDDVPAGQTDYTLANFSIARDVATTIPLLRQAKVLNPSLRLMGTPWSPPAWMKTTGQVNGGHLKDSGAVYNAYADYFVKYVKAYAAQGLTVDYVSLQNEPWFETTYPSMGMDPPEAARLTKLVGAKFWQNGIGTKVLGWDHNWDNARYYVPALLSDPQASQYIAGVAFHGYAGDVSAQSQIHAQFPDKGIYFTELSSSLSNTNFASDLIWDMKNLFVGGARNWSKTVVRWNLALDETGGPHLPGGAEGCRGMVTVNGTTGAVTYNLEYYSMGHVSKFVQPGAFRVDSDADATAAFVNPDGTTALVAYNDGTSARTFDVRWQGRTLSYALPALSVATFSWADPKHVGVWLTTGDKTRLLARQADVAFGAVAPSTWTAGASASWASPSNWSNGVPNFTDADARFLSTGAARAVGIDAPVTAGVVRFFGTGSYMFAGASALTLRVSSGSATLVADAGTHTFQVPVTFASDASVAGNGSATLTFAGPVTVAAGKRVVDDGSAGNVVLQSDLTLADDASLTVGGSQRLAMLTVGAAADFVMKPATGAALVEVDRLLAADGATIDIGDNALRVAYDSAGAAADLLAMIRTGYDRGRWDGGGGEGAGITSSIAAARADRATGLGYAEVDGALSIRYTWYGDANLDGRVDAADVAQIVPAPSGATWHTGDFNYDGRVSADDYAALGLGLAAHAQEVAAAVPEPLGPGAGVALAAASLARYRRSRPP